MLSSIGQAAIRRTGGAGAVSTNKLRQVTWLVHRVNTTASTQFALSSRRRYATALKSTKTATKTPKTGVKAKSKAKAAPKKTVKKTAAKTGKKKAVKKIKKKPAVKPKKKPAKKALTPEAKEKAEIKKLKVIALWNQVPKAKSSNAWTVFNSAEAAGSAKPVSEQVKLSAAKFKALSPTELERLNHTASENKTQNEIAYKTWIESHTPDQIRLANNARRLLSKKTKKTIRQLRDERQPKRAATPVMYFLQERYASGDFKGIKVTDSASIIAGEYKALSPSERKVFEDRSAASRTRYQQEYKTVYKRDAPSSLRKAKA